MKSKISSKWPLVITSTLGVILFSSVFYLLTFSLPGRNPSPEFPLATSSNANDSTSADGAPISKVQPGLPIRLKIPKLKIDAVVEQIGTTPQGAMGVPTGPKTTAWLNLGPRPGEVGSAAIAGHFGWLNSIPAVFDNLHNLKTGDKVDIVDEKGTTLRFVVRESRTFDQNEEASSVFNSNDGKAHLNLITCQGVWNKGKKSYSERLVVFTDRE